MRKFKGWTDERINHQIINIRKSKFRLVEYIKNHVAVCGDRMNVSWIAELCQIATDRDREISELVGELESRDCTRANRRNAQCA